ncbi:MAG: group III truncated hemoglobin [Bacteroidota bacterium]
MQNKSDILTEADIQQLVDEFYKKVVADPVIGFIFTEVVQLSWQKHIPVMYSFWGSLLLGTNTYAGNPMIKHLELDKLVPLTKEHFERWLALWEGTVNENFEGPKADEAISRAKSIAGVMQLKIAQYK